MKEYRDRICIAIVGLVFASLVFAAWVLPPKEFSDSERRKLAQFPEFSLAAVRDGSFVEKFERYAQDQFPMRDTFRTVKAFLAYDMYRQLDNNGIYLQDGYAAKLEYPLDEDSVHHAADRFGYIYENFLVDKNVKAYVSIVPDKGYFLQGRMVIWAWIMKNCFRSCRIGCLMLRILIFAGRLTFRIITGQIRIGARRGLWMLRRRLRRGWAAPFR